MYNRPMFVRQYKTKNKKTGKIYIKHQLVQSYRTAVGPRQRVIMNLGKLNLAKSEWRRLAFALEGRLSGQEALVEEPEITSEVERVLRNYNFYKLRKKRKGERPKCLSVNLEKVATTCCFLQMKNTPHFTRKVPHFS